MWRAVLSAVIASVIIITAYIYIPTAPQTAPAPYEIDRPAPTAPAAVAKPASSTAPAAVKATVDSLVIDLPNPPSNVVRTNQVKAKVKFSNKGTINTTYRAEVSLDGKVALTRDVVVAPGSQEEIFVINIADLGSHKLSLGDKSSSFRIVEPGLPFARKETKYATLVYNHGAEDVLVYSEKNIETAYTEVSKRLGIKINDKLTVYVYISREDAAEGISTISKSPALAERYYKFGIVPEPIDDVMHVGSSTLVTCANIFTSWAMKKAGLYTVDSVWLSAGIAEYLSYEIARSQDKKTVDTLLDERVQRLKKAMDEGKLLPIADMENQRIWSIREEDKELGTLQHDEAYVLGRYVLGNWGLKTTLSLFKTALIENSTQDAVFKAMGIAYKDLEYWGLKRWIVELSKPKS